MTPGIILTMLREILLVLSVVSSLKTVNRSVPNSYLFGGWANKDQRWWKSGNRGAEIGSLANQSGNYAG